MISTVSAHCVWKRMGTLAVEMPQLALQQLQRQQQKPITGCGDDPSSILRGKTSLEVLFHPSRSLPPTQKGCRRSQGLSSGRPLALKPQQQQQSWKDRSLHSPTERNCNQKVKMRKLKGKLKIFVFPHNITTLWYTIFGISHCTLLLWLDDDAIQLNLYNETVLRTARWL